MKRFWPVMGRLAGLPGAGALVIVLVLTFNAAQRGAPPGLRVFQPLITVSVPSPGGPPQPQGTPPAVPTPSATTPAYPPPGPTMTPPGPPTAVPTPTRVVLPPPCPPLRRRVLSRSCGCCSQTRSHQATARLPWPGPMRSCWNPGHRSHAVNPTRPGLLVAPDGRRILYTLWNNMNQRRAAIWTMNPDGSDKRLLVAATEEWFPEEAIWSPDGTQIAYRWAYLAGGLWLPMGANSWSPWTCRHPPSSAPVSSRWRSPRELLCGRPTPPG